MPRQGVDLNSGIYETPVKFLRAVDDNWPIMFDLACTKENNVLKKLRTACLWPGLFEVEGWVESHTAYGYTEQDNSLNQSWYGGNGYGWCNPPFSNIKDWVKKAYEESLLGARTVMLLPMAHDTNWARDFVRGKCLALDLHGRIKFEGNEQGYPKGLMLLVYAKGLSGHGNFDWQ